MIKNSPNLNHTRAKIARCGFLIKCLDSWTPRYQVSSAPRRTKTYFGNRVDSGGAIPNDPDLGNTASPKRLQSCRTPTIQYHPHSPTTSGLETALGVFFLRLTVSKTCSPKAWSSSRGRKQDSKARNRTSKRKKKFKPPRNARELTFAGFFPRSLSPPTVLTSVVSPTSHPRTALCVPPPTSPSYARGGSGTSSPDEKLLEGVNDCQSAPTSRVRNARCYRTPVTTTAAVGFYVVDVGRTGPSAFSSRKLSLSLIPRRCHQKRLPLLDAGRGAAAGGCVRVELPAFAAYSLSSSTAL